MILKPVTSSSATSCKDHEIVHVDRVVGAAFISDTFGGFLFMALKTQRLEERRGRKSLIRFNWLFFLLFTCVGVTVMFTGTLVVVVVIRYMSGNHTEFSLVKICVIEQFFFFFFAYC